MLRELIGIAREYGMTVIAEGVETEEQAVFLRDAGCDGIQGYYYSRPLPEDEFVEYLN